MYSYCTRVVDAAKVQADKRGCLCGHADQLRSWRTCGRLRLLPNLNADRFAVLRNLPTSILLLFLAAAVQTVKVGQFPLRSGCGENDPVVARLRAGDPVQIKFSLAGAAQACYAVSATVDGKTVEGN